jgi:hypothetical protein
MAAGEMLVVPEVFEAGCRTRETDEASKEEAATYISNSSYGSAFTQRWVLW